MCRLSEIRVERAMICHTLWAGKYLKYKNPAGKPTTVLSKMQACFSRCDKNKQKRELNRCRRRIPTLSSVAKILNHTKTAHLSYQVHKTSMSLFKTLRFRKINAKTHVSVKNSYLLTTGLKRPIRGSALGTLAFCQLRVSKNMVK